MASKSKPFPRRLYVIAAASVLAAITPPVVMLCYFGRAVSHDPSAWASTATFVGGISGSVIAALNVVAFVSLAKAVHAIEEQRETANTDAEKQRDKDFIRESNRRHDESLAQADIHAKAARDLQAALVAAQVRPVLRLEIAPTHPKAADVKVVLHNDGLGPAIITEVTWSGPDRDRPGANNTNASLRRVIDPTILEHELPHAFVECPAVLAAGQQVVLLQYSDPHMIWHAGRSQPSSETARNVLRQRVHVIKFEASYTDIMGNPMPPVVRESNETSSRT